MSLNCSCHTCVKLANWNQMCSNDDTQSNTSGGEESPDNWCTKQKSVPKPETSGLSDSLNSIEISNDGSSKAEEEEISDISKQSGGKFVNNQCQALEAHVQDDQEVNDTCSQRQCQRKDHSYDFPTMEPSLTPESTGTPVCEGTSGRMNKSSHVKSTCSKNGNCKTGQMLSSRPQNAQQPLPQPHHAINRPPIKVFVTYALEVQNYNNHLKTVSQICSTLVANGVDVAVDVYESILCSLSSSDWLDVKFSTSNYVLICISPGYRDVVEGASCSAEESDVEKALHTTYIYRRMHNEYIRSWSKNRRFLPVLCSGAVANNIPKWLRDTLFYRWPQDCQSILYRLYGIERYRRPRRDPIPQFIIQRYADYVARDGDEDGNTVPKRVS